MPYCVKCGVELVNAAVDCPLCRTPVLLPMDVARDRNNGEISSRYPDRLPETVKHKTNLIPTKPVVLLATFLLLIPFLICLMIDLKAHGGVTWSFYPMTSLFLLWLLVAYPTFLRRHPFVMAFTVDTLSIALFLVSLDLYADRIPNWSFYPASALVLIWLCGMFPIWFSRLPFLMPVAYFVAICSFLWVIELLSNSGPWLFALAMPIAGAASLYGLGVWLTARFLKGSAARAALIALWTTLLLFIVDGCIQQFTTGVFQPFWSPVASAVGLPLSALLLAIHLSTELRAFLQKKFHM